MPKAPGAGSAAQPASGQPTPPPKRTDGLKRYLRVRLDNLPTLQKIPIVGEIVPPLDSLDYVFVQALDTPGPDGGLTESEIASINEVSLPTPDSTFLLTYFWGGESWLLFKLTYSRPSPSNLAEMLRLDSSRQTLSSRPKARVTSRTRAALLPAHPHPEGRLRPQDRHYVMDTTSSLLVMETSRLITSSAGAQAPLKTVGSPPTNPMEEKPSLLDKAHRVGRRVGMEKARPTTTLSLRPMPRRRTRARPSGRRRNHRGR